MNINMAIATSSEIRDDSVVIISARPISSAMGSAQAILLLDSGIYFGLNPVGARIWHLGAEPRRFSGIPATWLNDYQVPTDRRRAGLRALLEMLRVAGQAEICNG